MYRSHATLCLATLGAILFYSSHARGDENKAVALSARDVADSWYFPAAAEKVNGWESVSDEKSRVCTMSWRLKDAAFEDAWKFYASKCGITEKYAKNNFHIGGGVGKAGEYNVVDDAFDGHRQTTFVLRGERGVIFVNLHQNSDKTLSLSISAVVP